MNGLDRIIDEINADAKASAEKIISDADAKAERIISRAKEKASETEKAAEQQAELEYRRIISRARSSGEVTSKRVILREKQHIISKMLNAAHTHILSLDDSEYFDYMQKLLDKYADTRKGVVMLNAEDKKRVTPAFLKAAENKMLTLSEETRSIDGGFILVYGDIEENCSLSALMDEEKDRLHDAVNELLFS